MTLSPEERTELEEKVSEEEHHIQQKEHRLATGVGPKEKVEIEKDIEESQSLIRDWIDQIRSSET
jgi:hypothetical protein